MKIRHSSLPKLALCGQYEGSSGTSEAAARGNRLDAMFRHAWDRGDFEYRNIPEEDVQAVQWAVVQCVNLGGGMAGLSTKEEHCKVQTPGIEHTGTADGVAIFEPWSVDLKSGQIYNYTAQMAAYAYGLMSMYRKTVWTTHLLFCDQRQLVTHEWTLETARETVQRILANVGTAPRENDYCGWCAKSLTCSARVQAQELAVQTSEHAITPQDGSFLALLDDPERLGLFLKQCATLDDFRDAAKEKARALLEAGTPVPGWKLQKARVTEYVEAEDVAAAVAAGEIGASDAIRALGSLSGKKAEKLWSEAGVVFPESLVQRKIGQQPLVASK
jgi:hypothetical protein